MLKLVTMNRTPYVFQPGSILGPTLFSLYINDQPSACENCDILMYADDTVIFTHGKTTAEVAIKLTDSEGHILA